MKYFCCDERRRSAVRDDERAPRLNGIDYLEVIDRAAESRPLRQRRLRVVFVRREGPDFEALKTRFRGTAAAGAPELVRITGGERVRGFAIERAAFEGHDLIVQVDQPGDYSTYTLHLHEADSTMPLAGLDPELASVDFSFKAECASEFDCAPRCECPVEVPDAPELDYLARDYASFRQLLLDRMSLLAPGWRERNPADLGVTLVELLAYVGDYLSYRQDAIATEAYLGTARQRVSIRRHARLLDYPVHEGCNARAWIHVWLKDTAETRAGIRLHSSLRASPTGLTPVPPGEPVIPAAGLDLRRTRFTTAAGHSTWLPTEPTELRRVLEAETPVVFEPMESADLFHDHNAFRFHTWSDARCCLPRGATKATLAGNHPQLRVGLVLVVAEVTGPRTGDPADADGRKRHAVRLVSVRPSEDRVTDEPVTEIEWSVADALPFPLCLSSIAESGPRAGRTVHDVSVAWGNLVLADHGLTLFEPESLDLVPDPDPALAPVQARSCGPCAGEIERLAPVRFRPRLKEAGLAFAAPYRAEQSATSAAGASSGPEFRPATDALAADPRRALPAIVLGAGQLWEPLRDLLGSEAIDRRFVVEIENDGRAVLRFGDDRHGMQPASGTAFQASYRTGNGNRGNVGADSINRISAPALFALGGSAILRPVSELIERVTNPLPAQGGTEPETIEEVRQYAPQAFREPRRCVTPDDYAQRAAQHPEVSRAAATVRWTGSWPTLFLTVDRRGALPVDTVFEDRLRHWLERFRLAGHDLEIEAPRFVAIELTLFACVQDAYSRSDVRRALLEVFSSGTRPDGTRGFFHPDAWTFGQTLWRSRIEAAAQAVAGVRWAEVRVLRRQGSNDEAVPDALTFGRTEIVRLDNDPSFPDRGQLTLGTGGGR